MADAAQAAQDAATAAQKLREQADAEKRAQEEAANAKASASNQNDDFVGSGGVGSLDQLDAIRRGYEERGISDASGLGGASDIGFQSNMDATGTDNNQNGSGA